MNRADERWASEQRERAKALILCHHPTFRPVSRPVVDDDHLEVMKDLCKHARYGLTDERSSLVRRDDHRYQGRGDFSHVRRR